MSLILDTNFVIQVERESRRGPGVAAAFIAMHPSEVLCIAFTVAGELAAGRSASDPQVWQELCRPYRLLPWSMDIAWQYGQTYRDLQSKGTLIGANDLWIASTALVHRMALVTNNVDEFRRVEGLDVLSY